MKITFEQLPQAVTLLQETVDDIKRLLLHQVPQKQSEIETLLTVPETAQFLSLSVPTIYALISKGSLPSMKRSKRVYFSKPDLIKYLKEGKKKTTFEIEAEVDSYLVAPKRKGGKNV